MTKTSALVPLVALGIVAAALSGPPSVQGQTETHSQKEPKTQTESRTATAADAPDDPFDALEVLAESFGVDISPAGLQRLALREYDVSADRNRPQSRRDEASRFVGFFTGMAKGALNVPSKAEEPAYQDLVKDFFERQPLDTTDLRLKVLHDAADRYETDVSFLIATLPDPIDSFTGWQFDPMLDAITQAVAASDYIFERYHFPDFDTDHASSGGAARGRAHEGEASVVLFRRHLAQSREAADSNGNGNNGDRFNRERLVLLIVHENPSAGVHARALVNAIRVVTRWMNTGQPRDPAHSVIRILGPTFSGSADSIARELSQANRRRYLENYSVRVVSGSATDFNNKAILEDAVPDERVSFRATVQPDCALMPKLFEQIRKAGWSRPIAVLFEGNTQYGRGMLNIFGGDEMPRSSAQRQICGEPGVQPLSELILVPFPMNVSRVRVTPADGKSDVAEVLGLPSRLRPLSMEMQGQPADQIPQLSPKTTSSYVELALSGILQTMRKEHVGTVALMATDPRDKLFLAQQISREVPNASIFTAESDSVYVHPDYSSYMQGALIASTYPLYSGNQRWSYGFQGGVERLEFANGSAKGIYNAALALLNYDENGRPLKREYASGEDLPRLIEYGAPGADCTKGCVPPVWISVVGRGGTWPVQAHPVEGSDYVFRITSDERTAPASLETFPSPYFHGIFLVMTVAVLVLWAGARSETWLRLPGFRGRMAALVSGSQDERGRDYLLVGMTSLLMLELFMAAVYMTRARLDEPGWEWQFVSSTAAAVLVALTSVALADLARRIMSRLLKHDRKELNNRFDPRAWSGIARLGGVTVCIWGVVTLLYYAWTHAFEPRELAVGFTVRAMDFASGVSPTLPVLLLGFAIVTWSLAELTRLRTPSVALADTSVHPLMQQTVGTSLQRLTPAWNLLNRSTLSVPSPLVIVVCLMLGLTCLTLFDPIVRPLVTVEGPWFGRFFSSAILIVQVMISLSLLQFVYLWTSLKRLFDQMAWHRPAPAYEHVPRALCPPGLFPKTPRLMELQLLVTHWRCSLEKAGRQDDSDKLTELFEAEMRSADGQFWSKSGTWRALLAAAAEPQTSSDPAPPIQARELLMEMCAALVIRDAIARLGHNLLFVIGGVLFVFCSHTLFPFQLDAQLAELAWVYISLTFGAILMVLVQMKRNEILRRLTSEDPTKRTGWDSEFFWRVAVFALIPLLTIFAAQFPDIGGMLMKWVDPVRKILP